MFSEISKMLKIIINDPDLLNIFIMFIAVSTVLIAACFFSHYDKYTIRDVILILLISFAFSVVIIVSILYMAYVFAPTLHETLHS